MSLTDDRINEIIENTRIEFDGQEHFEVGMKKSSSDEKSNVLGGSFGCFEDMLSAIRACKEASKKLIDLSIKDRKKIIESMRQAGLSHARNLAMMARDETGFGVLEHKELKNILASTKTPGVEDIVPNTYTGDDGLTLVEGAPFGVIGAITPSTNPSATVINNSISMVAGGNCVVFNPHPSAKGVSIEAIKILNKAIFDVCGIENVLTTVAEPSIKTSKELMENKDVRILVVTGGEAVVDLAMRMGKKVIGAGPGNPPVVVDDSADVRKAGNDIVRGASFDNNILCIAEKEVFVFESVADELLSSMKDSGAYFLNADEVKRVEKKVLEQKKDGGYAPNKKFVGKSANYILENSEIEVNKKYSLLICEVDGDHPFVLTEMLMPVLPVVRVKDLDEAIFCALKAENGCKHTAIMHSKNVSNLTKVARTMDTTIFVKNAPSFAGLGFEGEGYTTLTISTPTGEGLTSAKDFVRWRRCTLAGEFRIV